MPDRKRLGSDAEDRAATFLLEKGYTLVTRRFKARAGEIDIVAMDGESLVFVEVRYRSSGPLTPEETLTSSKVQALENAANDYLAKSGQSPAAYRFDFIAVDDSSIRHYPDAFRSSD